MRRGSLVRLQADGYKEISQKRATQLCVCTKSRGREGPKTDNTQKNEVAMAGMDSSVTAHRHQTEDSSGS